MRRHLCETFQIALSISSPTPNVLAPVVSNYGAYYTKRLYTIITCIKVISDMNTTFPPITPVTTLAGYSFI